MQTNKDLRKIEENYWEVKIEDIETPIIQENIVNNWEVVTEEVKTPTKQKEQVNYWEVTK